MCKEADAAGAGCSLFAEPGAILCRVEPALEDAMGEFTVVATRTATGAPEVGARHRSVRMLTRITAAGILARVHEGALGPVMGVSTGARTHLESVHAELVRGIDAALDVWQRRIHGILLLAPIHGDRRQRRRRPVALVIW